MKNNRMLFLACYDPLMPQGQLSRLILWLPFRSPAGFASRPILQAIFFVGWVEHSETHRSGGREESERLQSGYKSLPSVEVKRCRKL